MSGSSADNADGRQSCKAVVCLENGGTALESQQVPSVGRGEMLLRTSVVGFCGTDLFKLQTGGSEPGTVLGHELVGTVVETGDGVDQFQTGNRVVVPHHVSCGECHLCTSGAETMCETFKENLMFPGGFADYVLIKRRAVEHAAYVVPDGIDDFQAVFVEPAACVLRGINQARFPEEGTAVVLGAGSMGLLHLLALKATYPGVRVIVVDPNESRLSFAMSLGADAVALPGPDALEMAFALSGSYGADAVFDTVGGNKTLEAGLDICRPGGSVVLFAHAPDGMQASFDLNRFFKREQRVIGTYSGALTEQKQVFDLICSGALDPSPLVTHVMPLDDFDKCVELVTSQQALKVLFTPSRSAAGG